MAIRYGLCGFFFVCVCGCFFPQSLEISRMDQALDNNRKIYFYEKKNLCKDWNYEIL